MGMFGEAAGSILGLQKFLGVKPAGTTVRIAISQLEALLNQTENITLIATKFTTDRRQTDLTTSLEATSWSVAQCLDHLAQTTNAFVPPIASAIACAPRLTTNRGLRTGALTRLFIRNLEPPYRLRFKVLASLAPRQHHFNSAWDAFEISQVQLARTIQSAVGFAIDQVRIDSPVYARFSYNVYGAFRMLTAHQRRHLWQMERILEALDGGHVRYVS